MASLSPARKITQALSEAFARVPTSHEPISPSPKDRAREIARSAALQAAGISGTLALPPGLLGLATILPDLLAIWRIQQAMVADIAAAYGKSSLLKREAMVFCLFKHGSAALMRDLVTRAGQRYIVREVGVSALRGIFEKVGLRVSERVIGKGISRLIPIVGALGVGAYAYYDTTQVAATAIELFSHRLELEPPKAEGPS